MKRRVSEVLKAKGRSVIMIDRASMVSQAVQIMNEHNVGCVLVGQGNDLQGVFSERDVLVRVVAEDKNPADTFVIDVMTAQVITASSDLLVGEALHKQPILDLGKWDSRHIDSGLCKQILLS